MTLDPQDKQQLKRAYDDHVRAINDLEEPRFGRDAHENEENAYYTTEAKLERIADEIGVGPEHYEELQQMIEHDEVSALSKDNELSVPPVENLERPRWLGRANRLIEDDGDYVRRADNLERPRWFGRAHKLIDEDGVRAAGTVDDLEGPSIAGRVDDGVLPLTQLEGEILWEDRNWGSGELDGPSIGD